MDSATKRFGSYLNVLEFYSLEKHFKLLFWPCFNYFWAFKYLIKCWLVYVNYLENICNPTNILSFKFWRKQFDMQFEFEFEFVLEQSDDWQTNCETWQSLAGDYRSLIIRASQISSTTRNLIPRFKRWSKGESSGYKILSSLLGLGCSSRRS